MEYKKQADQFLKDTNTTLEIREAEPNEKKSPVWKTKDQDHGIHYICTLKNDRHIYSFDFWDSIHNKKIIKAIKEYQFIESMKNPIDYKYEDILKKENINYRLFFKREEKAKAIKQYEPTAYNILACIDVNHDTFEDFCSDFGYDEDSRTAYQIYKSVQIQSNNLHALFTSDQIARLQEIN